MSTSPLPEPPFEDALAELGDGTTWKRASPAWTTPGLYERDIRVLVKTCRARLTQAEQKSCW
ncbi:MAG: exodeoxyribonuclease VII small subunit [Gemmataceae bacterium]